MAGKIGFEPFSQLVDPMFMTVGNTGAALSLMMLVAALEDANPGDRLMCVSYGDGCDVLIMKATEGIDEDKGQKSHKAPP